MIQQARKTGRVLAIPVSGAAQIGYPDIRVPLLRIGLLGCGAIGHLIASHAEGFEITVLYDEVPDRVRELAEQSGGVACQSFDMFLDAEIDLVVEAASVDAVRIHGRAVLEAGKDLVVMSVSALADPVLCEQLRRAALSSGRKVRVPSGAVMGLDNLKIGRIGGIDQLRLRTTKSPRSLGLDVCTRTLVFQGPAGECVDRYPRNVNVSVALALAAGREVDVELWADPGEDRNVHEILVEGAFGQGEIVVRNLPSPQNPATSYLAAFSVIALLRDLSEPIVVGT